MSGLRDFTDELLAQTTTAREDEKVFVTEDKCIPNVNSERFKTLDATIHESEVHRRSSYKNFATG